MGHWRTDWPTHWHLYGSSTGCLLFIYHCIIWLLLFCPILLLHCCYPAATHSFFFVTYTFSPFGNFFIIPHYRPVFYDLPLLLPLHYTTTFPCLHSLLWWGCIPFICYSHLPLPGTCCSSEPLYETFYIVGPLCLNRHPWTPVNLCACLLPWTCPLYLGWRGNGLCMVCFPLTASVWNLFLVLLVLPLGVLLLLLCPQQPFLPNLPRQEFCTAGSSPRFYTVCLVAAVSGQTFLFPTIVCQHGVPSL